MQLIFSSLLGQQQLVWCWDQMMGGPRRALHVTLSGDRLMELWEDCGKKD